MGNLRKKWSWLKTGVLGLAILMLGLGGAFLNLPQLAQEQAATLATQSIFDVEWTDDGIRASTYSAGKDEYSKILRIQDAGELAFFNYEITNDIYDYSDWTVQLVHDLDMGEHATNQGQKIIPQWTPIPTGRNGKNTNVTFDGGNNKIKNLNIIINNNTTKPESVSVGLFADLVCGGVTNVTFLDTVIHYGYSCSENAAFEAHPTEPINISLGVVAGTATGADINNVTIKNAQVALTAPNISGHSYNLGAAVGRLNEHFTSLSETATQTLGVVDAVDVQGGSVNLVLNNITDVNHETRGFVGGLVGASVSSKIINNKVNNTVTVNLNKSTGSYYVGGIVGLTALHTRSENTVHVTGLLNNITMSAVKVNNATIKTKLGLIAGKIDCGWARSNFYFGTEGTETGTGTNGNELETLFGEENFMVVLYSPECIGYQNIDALDWENNYDDVNDKLFYANRMAEHSDYATCMGYILNNSLLCMSSSSTHTKRMEPLLGEGTKQDNYAYDSFQNPKFLEQYEESINEFEMAGGFLYEIGQKMVRWDFASDADQLREAVNQFKIWQIDRKGGEPRFGNYLSQGYEVIFDANGGGWANEAFDNMIEAYDEEKDEFYLTHASNFIGTEYEVLFDPTVHVAKKQYLYREVVPAIATEACPLRIGYSFAGWCTLNSEGRIDQEFDPDEDFGIMGAKTLTLYARWRTNPYEVTFMVGGNVYATQTVLYQERIIRPENPTAVGKDFLGWFRVDGFNDWETAYAESWHFTSVDGVDCDLMPAQHLTLYAGWFDIFEELRNELAATARMVENEEYYNAESFAALVAARNLAETRISYEESGNSEAYSGPDSMEIMTMIKNAKAGLYINMDKVAKLPPMFDENLRANKYVFLFDADTYEDYVGVKNRVKGYLLEVENEIAKVAEGDGEYLVANDVELLVSYIDWVNSAYENLLATPNVNLGEDQTRIENLVNNYENLQEFLENYDPEIYETDSRTDFAYALANFNEAFANNNPFIEELQGAVTNLQNAKSKLVTLQAQNGSDKNKNEARMAISPIILGVLIFLGLVVVAGGYIGVDLAVNVYLPRKKAATKAQQEAQEQKENDQDTYI